MAIIYCDSRVAGPGTGTEADPYKVIPSISGNNTYYLARGSVFKQSILCQSANVNFYARGVGPNPIIDADGATNALMHQWGSNVNFAGIDFTGAGEVGLLIRSANAGSSASNIVVASCRFYGNGRNNVYPADGTKLDGVVLTSPLTGVTYLWCESYDNAGHGYDTLGVVDATWIGCTAKRNGFSVAGHGFSLHPFHQIATSGWSVVSGTIYRRALSAGESVQKVIDRTGVTVLARNAGNYASLTANQWDQVNLAGTEYLYINIGSAPEGKTVQWKRAAHGPFRYLDCVATDNYTDLPTSGEGHGFAADDLSGDATYDRCVSLRNQGAGFQNQWGDRIRHRACIADFNSLSNFRTTGYTDDCWIEHSCSTRSANHGIAFSPPHTNCGVRNSISAFNGTGGAFYGILFGTTVGTGQNNLTFGNGPTGTNHTVNVTATGHITVDPLFLDPDKPWLGLRQNSPVLGRGTYIQGARDRFSRKFGHIPNIGPWAIIWRQ